MKKKKLILAIIFLSLFALSFSFKKKKENIISKEAIKTVSLDSSRAEIYPTYFENHCFIKGVSDPSKEIRVEIFDANGLLVKTFVLEDPLTENPKTLDFSDLTEKVLIVRVYEGLKLLKKEKLVKK